MRTLASIGLVVILCLNATAQAGKDRALSGAELHNLARTVSVLIVERTANGGTRQLGSGVWLAEGVVATCWHVVSVATGPIKISVGTGDVVTAGESTFEGVYRDYAASVVASDPDADTAILKTEDNPFKDTGAIIRTPTSALKPRLSVAFGSEEIPPAGTQTVLAGYPMSGVDLLSQTGNIAGTGIPGATRGIKGLRILVSVVSNPGNSGGPVLNDHGELIGLLEGNLPSPAKDDTQSQALYFRPKKDAKGNILTDERGNPQVEVAGMIQNSGISVVIPYRLIDPLFKQAEGKK